MHQLLKISDMVYSFGQITKIKGIVRKILLEIPSGTEISI